MKVECEIKKIYADRGDWASVMAMSLTDGTCFKAAGTIIGAAVGMTMVLEGEMVNDPKWGEQFKVTGSRQVIATRQQVVEYLSSSYIKGIGPSLAEKIFNMFGARSVDVVENHPEELVKVRGISAAKAEKASQSCRENRAFLNLMEYLGGKKWNLPYRIVYIIAVFAGSVISLSIVWNMADCFNALMAIPNLLSLLFLYKVLVKETNYYLWQNNLDKDMDTQESIT